VIGTPENLTDLSSAQTNQSTTETVENKPSSKQFVFDEKFIDYIKKVEGFIPTAKDIGDGVITGGYGNTKNFSIGDKVNKDVAESLLIEDLNEAVAQVRRQLGSDVFNSLDKNQIQLLSDITFNVGSLKGFPKFTEAILRKDKDMAIKESKRFWKEKGKKKELKNRNKEFSNLINNMLEGEG
jgi:GH24 family phage-related lysozyme (muramidase)